MKRCLLAGSAAAQLHAHVAQVLHARSQHLTRIISTRRELMTPSYLHSGGGHRVAAHARPQRFRRRVGARQREEQEQLMVAVWKLDAYLQLWVQRVVLEIGSEQLWRA